MRRRCERGGELLVNREQQGWLIDRSAMRRGFRALGFVKRNNGLRRTSGCRKNPGRNPGGAVCDAAGSACLAFTLLGLGLL